jgi:hypothetical protein
VIGLRTKLERHIADEVHRLPAEANLRGEPHPLCGVFLDARAVKKQRVDLIAPAVVCPRCVAVARRWYGWWYFVPFDSVQRRRLLDALTWDLEHA